jgi:CBS domain-containing protein
MGGAMNADAGGSDARASALSRRFLSRGMLVRQSVNSSLVSVSGLIGAPVSDLGGADVGRLVDVVVRWDRGVYPQVSGLVIRIGLRRSFVHVGDVANIGRRAVELGSTKVDLKDFERREGEQLLRKDVIDHQLLDVDGARVVRAADLYLAHVGSRYWVVGVDVSFVSFLRRLLPAWMGSRATAERVLDFASIQPFGRPGAPVKLRRPHRGLQRLRPADLADLLEDLGRSERRELLSLLPVERAADVLEEMEPDHLRLLLRDVPVGQAAGLVERMESDEAVDALRDLSPEDRADLLDQMPADRARELRSLLEFPEGLAGGIMTTNIVVLTTADTIGDALQKVRTRGRDEAVDGLVVVDDHGRLLDDLSLMDLLVSDPGMAIGDVIGPPYPGTVLPDADLGDVVEELIGNRGSSLVVVDLEHRPIGRILADDVIDALLATDTERRWPWQQRGSVS